MSVKHRRPKVNDLISMLTDIYFGPLRSEEHTSELQSQSNLVCRLLLEKKKKKLAIETRWSTSGLPKIPARVTITECLLLTKICSTCTILSIFTPSLFTDIPIPVRSSGVLT